MDIRQLKYFIAIVEERQISAAAARLHMSQPPLSQQLKAMEAEVGAVLVERSGKFLEITEAGKAMYKYALQMMQLLEEAKAEVTEIGQGIKGVLSIGINTLSSVELPGLLQKFKLRYPNVTYKIQQNESALLCGLVKNRGLELAIIRLPLELDDFSVLHLNTEPFYLMISDQDYPAGKELTLPEIMNYPIMLPSTEGLGVHYSILMACSMSHMKPNIIAECSDISLLLTLVSSGFGAAVVPETIVRQHEGYPLHAYKISDVNLSTSTGLIWLKSHHLSRTAQHFVDLLTGI